MSAEVEGMWIGPPDATPPDVIVPCGTLYRCACGYPVVWTPNVAVGCSIAFICSQCGTRAEAVPA